MNDQFTRDLANEVGRIASVETLNMKFAEYFIRTIDGKDYVLGKNKKKGVFCEFNEYKLLFSLFSLVKSPLPRYFDNKYLINVVPIEAILQFCTEYGLPYEDKNLWEEHRYAGFEVGHFRYRIAVLYSFFLLWKAFYENDEASINLNMLLVGLKPADYSDHKQKRAHIKEWLARYVTTFGNHFSFEVDYNAVKDGFFLKLRTRNIFDTCYYQFATLLTNEDVLFKGNLKSCKACNAFFWGHGNKRYCEKCNRKTVWSRNHKNKKGELFPEKYLPPVSL